MLTLQLRHVITAPRSFPWHRTMQNTLSLQICGCQSNKVQMQRHSWQWAMWHLKSFILITRTLTSLNMLVALLISRCKLSLKKLMAGQLQDDSCVHQTLIITWARTTTQNGRLLYLTPSLNHLLHQTDRLAFVGAKKANGTS